MRVEIKMPAEFGSGEFKRRIDSARVRAAFLLLDDFSVKVSFVQKHTRLQLAVASHTLLCQIASQLETDLINYPTIPLFF